jgi:hypothetical protein
VFGDDTEEDSVLLRAIEEYISRQFYFFKGPREGRYKIPKSRQMTISLRFVSVRFVLILKPVWAIVSKQVNIPCSEY